jgi:putative membrane protein
MTHLLVRWLTLTAAILVSAYLIEGIRVAGFFSALCAAALLGIFNAVLLKMVSGLIRGFDVYGLWPAVVGSLVISLVSGLLSMALRERRPSPSAKRPDESGVIDLQDKGNNRWE